MADGARARRRPDRRRILLCSVLFAATTVGVHAQRETVHIATEEWEPFIGSGLSNNGVLAEIITEAFLREGIAVTIRYYPWARALKMVEQGTADGLLGAFYSEERSAYIHYPNPIARQSTSLFHMRRTQIDFKQLSDLAGRSIGVVRSAVTGTEFDKLRSIERVEAINIEQLIRMLVLDRVDLIAGPTENIKHVIRKAYGEYIDDIQQVEKPIELQEIYCGISKKARNAEALVRLLNAGLEKIRADGTYAMIIARHGMFQ